MPQTIRAITAARCFSRNQTLHFDVPRHTPFIRKHTRELREKNTEKETAKKIYHNVFEEKEEEEEKRQDYKEGKRKREELKKQLAADATRVDGEENLTKILSIKDLQQQAAIRGLGLSGSRKILLERILKYDAREKDEDEDKRSKKKRKKDKRIEKIDSELTTAFNELKT